MPQHVPQLTGSAVHEVTAQPIPTNTHPFVQAGSVTKNLKISPGAKDTDGTLLFTLSQSGPQKSSIMVPVTRSEFVVSGTAFKGAACLVLLPCLNPA